MAIRGDPAKLRAAFTKRSGNVTPGLNATVRLVQSDSTRVALIVVTSGSGAPTLWMDTTISALIGIPLPLLNGPTILTYRDIGAMVQDEWFVFGTTGGDLISFAEVLYTPWALE